jgi:death on curing protein
MSIKYLSQFDLLQIRTRLAASLRTSFDTMNLDSLQAALAAPRQNVFGHEPHPTLWSKAAVLLIRLINNHPFYDGNKRIASRAVHEFLYRNGYELLADESVMMLMTRRIVTEELDVDALAIWLEQNSISRLGQD